MAPEISKGGRKHIYVCDNMGGMKPVEADMKRDGEFVCFMAKKDGFTIMAKIDDIMSVLGDEGHG